MIDIKTTDIKKYSKYLEFESGEVIKIKIELVNVKNKNLKTLIDFLDAMFKEIKESIF
ncbi:hypothetical protein Q604_UNBC07301G0018 [human gut metagenome]|uniref:Uncharacterized protein n=1 Tax=human gut metagenome TaxID=408170 RepID=W1Y7Z0_9ZZZZ|nr:hypothetical protein [Peptostreptococcaceae bacterium]